MSVAKQGVRNEIQIASDIGRQIGDDSFIIPLKLAAFEAPFLIVHAQYIDFEESWATGLRVLLNDLREKYTIPRRQTTQLELWKSLQLTHGKEVINKPETLVSNWLEARRLPSSVYYLPPTASRIHVEHLGKFPRVEFADGLLSSHSVPNSGQLSLPTTQFLADGWPTLGIQVEDARRRFTALANEGLAVQFALKGLNSYSMANRQIAWWMGKGTPDGRLGFRWTRFSGSRQLQGQSAKRKVYWHFGVSTAFRSKPFVHVRIKSRLLFTEDGSTPVKSAARMQRLRKSFAKSWRNARWRDMMLAFLYWLGDGTTIFNVPFGTQEDLVLTLPPMAAICPVSMPVPTSQDDDDDDPDVEFVDEEGSLEEDEIEAEAEA